MQKEHIFALLNSFASDPAYQEKRKETAPAEEMLYLSAFCFYEKGHYPEAAEDFTKLVLLHPFEKKYWFGLAASQQLAKNYKAALPAWGVAAILDKNGAYPHFHAAECLLSEGNVEEALLALEEAKRNFPDPELESKITALQEIWREEEKKQCHL